MNWGNQESFIAAVCVCSIFGAVAQGQDVKQTIFSTTRRFVVSGLPAADAATLARWTEDVAGRIEASTGTALVFAESEYIAIRALAGPSAAKSRVTKAQGYLDGRLQQKLVISKPDIADQEDILEGFCWLILNRQIVQRQTPAQRARSLGRAPDWLAVGLAQNLYRELRARNTRAVMDLLKQDVVVPMDKIVDLRFLPEGRWREKYFCGLAVGWLLSQPDYPERWQILLSRLASGQSLTADWISAEYLRQDDPSNLEPAWNRWLAQQKEVVFDFAALEQDRLEKLTTLLAINPADYGIEPPEGLPTPLVPADLIKYRKEKWARSLSAGLIMRTRMLALGQAPEFQDVVGNYIVFFEAVSGQRGTRPEKSLAALLKKADNARAAFGSRRQQEQQYVNVVARWLDLDSAAMASGQNAPALPPRTEVEKYMEDVERKMEAP